MRSNRRTAPLTFQSAATTIADSHFPPAVAGEDYERYFDAVWRQGERWFSRTSHQIARASIGMHEAREILSGVATRDLSRALYPQEERLLSELLQRGWTAVERWPDDAAPEIPSFLVSSNN